VDGGDAGGAQEVSVHFFVQWSNSDLEVFFESGFFLDQLNLNEAGNGGVVSEEFLLNQVGKRLQEYFQNEFDNFMGSLPPSNLPKQNVKNKVGRVNRKGSAR